MAQFEVYYGQKIRMKSISFQYRGPAATLYACWGLSGGGDWPNLEAGVFAYASVVVSAHSDWTWYANKPITADLEITPDMRKDVDYNAWYWMTKDQPSATPGDELEITMAPNLCYILEQASGDVRNMTATFALL